MSTRAGTLKVATPFEVSKALGSVGRYHYGVPEEHLDLAPYSPDVFTPYILSDGTLKAGDRYVDTLDNWLDFISRFGYPNNVVSALASEFAVTRKASFALSILGYIPLVLEIRKGATMAFSPHGKIVLQGAFGTSATTPVEQWSASMSYDVIGPDVGAMPNTIGATALAAIGSAWAAVISQSAGFGTGEFGSQTHLTDVAYYRAQADGKASGGQWERYHLPTAATGKGSLNHPLQVAMAVTLDAFGPKGGRFGRFFLPPISIATSEGRWPQADVSAILFDIRDALVATNTALNAVAAMGDVELVVASGRGSGENRPVRSLRVGRVPDTMRSRRNNLAEGYQTTAFQTPP